MSSAELENLARIGKLKREEPTQDEIDGLLRSAKERLKDAAGANLSYSSRFDLAYNAAHAFALAALRRAGYRSDTRYLVFQTLPHTIGIAAEKWRLLAKAHERRNLAEYEGYLEEDERLLAELIAVTVELRERVTAGGKGAPS
jgi:hypothetical protein